ncbi:TetR/AcrR family transcriptional regulator [Kineococcus rubinsiae]|uniref:TetR/AcrR family transcriptional regulator n=1 Tax=Kineococcus rubinsiae TaxID=2609562 RepID=UPI001431B32D|nr:TetR/AcrR family transcriptional regulator [Kineococcus rubinsiae]NIZ92996.1 TetR/AcrR family transcriptional regulator [Kineococcus rubinsiae]
MDERDRLLHLVADHVLDHGVTSLTLRGLGRATGSNNRMLLYYFGSKEALVGEALQAVGRERFPTFESAWTRLAAGSEPLRPALQQVWDAIADPANLDFCRLFFEVFGQAARSREGYGELLGEIADWQRPAVARLRREGLDARTAQARATELVALWRGLQMTLIATADPAHVHRVQAEALDAFCARCR